MEWQRIREKALERYGPTQEELDESLKKYQEVSDIVEEEFGLKTHFAGSASRGTCMAGDKDIDIFVLFPENVDRRELEDRGLEVGKTVFRKFSEDYEIEYAEHPYTKGEIEGHEIEIVPCYDVAADSIKSSVDRTPHHSRWVKHNLNDKQKKDVVLLKAFLRAQGLYGSSLKIEGFSGYLSEILIAAYGGFEELLKNTEDWDEKQIIDPEGRHEDGLPEHLEKKFSDEDLVVIDPVDPERNVASVLSKQNYARFIYSAWLFRQEPGMDFFEENKPEVQKFELKQELDRRSDILIIEFDAPGEVDDIVYPQMRKTLKRLTQQLEKHEFRIFEKGFHIDEKARIFFEIDGELPEIGEVQGPKVFHGSEHMAQFRSKYDKVFIKDSRLYAKTEREFTDAKYLLKQFLSGDLHEKGVPEHVAEKLDNYRFTDALNDDREWLKYLAEKLHV